MSPVHPPGLPLPKNDAPAARNPQAKPLGAARVITLLVCFVFTLGGAVNSGWSKFWLAVPFALVGLIVATTISTFATQIAAVWLSLCLLISSTQEYNPLIYPIILGEITSKDDGTVYKTKYVLHNHSELQDEIILRIRSKDGAELTLDPEAYQYYKFSTWVHHPIAKWLGNLMSYPLFFIELFTGSFTRHSAPPQQAS